MAQLMPLPLTVSCSSKIQIGFTFLVPAYPGCSGKEAVKWLLPSSTIVVMQCHMAQSNILKLLMLPAATLLTLTDDHPPPPYSYTNNAQ